MQSKKKVSIKKSTRLTFRILTTQNEFKRNTMKKSFLKVGFMLALAMITTISLSSCSSEADADGEGEGMEQTDADGDDENADKCEKCDGEGCDHCKDGDKCEDGKCEDGKCEDGKSDEKKCESGDTKEGNVGRGNTTTTVDPAPQPKPAKEATRGNTKPKVTTDGSN